MIRFYGTELERAGVTVRLGTDAATLDLDGWDMVLLATGTVAEDAELDAVELLASGTVARRGGGHRFRGDRDRSVRRTLARRAGQAGQPGVARGAARHRHQRHGARHLVGLLTELGGKSR